MTTKLITSTGGGRANSAATDVSSQIKDVDTWVYTTPSPYVDAVFGFTMLLTSDHTGFAQVGWREGQGNVRDVFTFFDSGPTDPGHFLATGPVTLNSAPAFKTHFDPPSGTFSFYVDGTQLGPASAQVSWSPGEAFVSAETATKASQMPGTKSSHDTFRNSIVKLGATWYAFDGTIRYVNNTYHDGVKNDSQSYDVWDKACS